MRITYVGHSTVLLEIGGLRLLTDPLLRGRIGHLRRHSSPPSPTVSERIDGVLLSHLHPDHLDRPSLRSLTAGTAVIAPKGAGRLIRRSGHQLVHEVEAGQSVELRPQGDNQYGDYPAVRIQATRADHDGRRPPFGPDAAAVGYLISVASRRIYFAGDTALFSEMEALAGDEDEPLDLAFLPISGWGPKLGPGHMGPAEAAQATALLRPRLVVPIHWGTLFPIGMGRWSTRHFRDPPRLFAVSAADLAPDSEVRVLVPGSSLQLD